MGEERRTRWERQVEWPLTAAACLFLAAYAWPILDTHLSRAWVTTCNVVTWTAWGMFAVDYFMRLYLSSNRSRFFRRTLPDLAVVVLPVLRPLRLLRLLTLLRMLQRYAGGSFRGRVAVYIAGATSLLVFVGALAVLNAERHAKGANITSFGDALWWAMTTVTTVGYGDRYPVTAQGRFIAVGVMIGGIALLGIVTGSLASWFLQGVLDHEDEARAATARDLSALSDEVTALRKELVRLRRNVVRAEARRSGG